MPQRGLSLILVSQLIEISEEDFGVDANLVDCVSGGAILGVKVVADGVRTTST